MTKANGVELNPGGIDSCCPQLAERPVQRVQVGIGHDLVHLGG